MDITTKKIPLQHVRPGVKALIVHQNKILLIKERIVNDVIFDFPGGGIEYGESFEQTLKREVFEEVGLKIEVERPVGNWWFMTTQYRPQTHIVCLGYQCRLVGENKIDTTNNPAGEDIFGADWYLREEILDDERQMLKKAEGMREAVENLRMG